MARPTLILDDAATGRLCAYGRVLAVIRADTPQEVSPALAAMEAARAAGHFVAGYFSYELGYALEPRLQPLLPRRRRQVPLLWFGVFEASERVEEGALESWCSSRAYAGPLEHEWDAPAYGQRFDRVHELIAAGDFYQANLTFRSRFAFAGDALALYRSLKAQSAARYGAYVDDGERQILSLSPELFFELAADGTITARPMKGTAPRGADAVADVFERQALAGSTKNRAENLMIVDLLRNDLGRIAEIGSVAVRDLFAVETYPTLHQMVSTVSARLVPGTDIAGLVRALFPCGSVTGAPKIHAMEIIAEMEESPRGVYCGAIGHFAPDGSARFNVAIRTLTIAGGRGELGIGGAVVQDSEAASEYAECLLKARYYEAARRPLELIETLRWSPEEGFVRLDRHLARMQRSAEAFGMPFNAARACEALNSALSPPCGEALRIRLTLNERGEFACTSTPLGETKKTWSYAISPHHISSADPMARHKTNWRELYDSEHARLTALLGCDEVLFLNEHGEVAEGSRTNVFLVRDGKLVTPLLASGALDGVLRRALIEEGHCIEATLTPDDLANADVYLGNSLRGLVRAYVVRAG
jgi:para-aminobenzoate synthetase / 4-amino-4-deoxychorismate lyase